MDETRILTVEDGDVNKSQYCAVLLISILNLSFLDAQDHKGDEYSEDGTGECGEGVRTLMMVRMVNVVLRIVNMIVRMLNMVVRVKNMLIRMMNVVVEIVLR